MDTLEHIPVLIQEVEKIFCDISPHTVVDATLGLGGHASMMCSLMDDHGIFVGFDRDQDNLVLAREKLREIAPGVEKHFIHSSFAEIDTLLAELKIPGIDCILYDLGVSSAHYDDGDRGFSIRYDAPLDMRFDRTTGKTAHDLVMTLSEYDLRSLLFRYADEKKAVHIARAIVTERKNRSIDTTFQLLDIIRASSYDRDSPKRVFQALRIAVNDEFGHIETSLAKAINLLNPGGVIAVITFHSIEDRIVKNFFAPYLIGTIDDITGQTTIPPILKKYTKKPIEPTPEEITKNPRSRSARMRVYEKVGAYREGI